MKKIISGNEAIALSFGDAGGVFASGYPGTPSTETLEEVARLNEVYCGVDTEKCTGCRACLKVTCVALGLVSSGDRMKVQIDPNICNGCGVCAQVCKFDAMHVA